MQPREKGSIKKGSKLSEIPDLEGYADRLRAVSVTTAEELFSLIHATDPELRRSAQGFLEASDEQMALIDNTLRGHLTPDFIAECESFIPIERPLGAWDPRSDRPPIK